MKHLSHGKDVYVEDSLTINIFPIKKRKIRPQPRPPTPASQYFSQNTTIQWLIMVDTLVATDNGLPGAHAPCGTNAKNCTCNRWLGVVWIQIETVDKKRFYWHVMIRVTWCDKKTTLEKWEFRSEVCMCGVKKDTSERVTRRCDDTSWREASEFLCMKTPLFLREFSNKKNCQKPQELRYSWHLFQMNSNSVSLIYSYIIWCQRFWEVVSFTGPQGGAWVEVTYGSL